MSELVTVVAHLHPLAQSERTVREFVHGATISEILSDIAPRAVGRIIVYCDGDLVEAERWEAHTPAPGANVVVKVVPAGDSGTAKDTGNKFAAASGILIFAGFVVSFIFPPVGLALVGVGLLLGGGALVSYGISQMYDNMAQASGKGSSFDNLPAIRGGRNRLNSWGKVPVIFGKHLVVPFYAARPYTEISGTDGVDQYVRQLFCVGHGPLKISQLKIGESLLATNTAATRNGVISIDGIFSGVDIQVYQDGTLPTLFPKAVIEDQPNIECSSGVENWKTTAAKTSRISVEITLPRGLYRYDSDGDKKTYSVVVEVRRRAVGSGTAWASCDVVGTFLITKALTKTLRYVVEQHVTVGQYEVGVKRITANDPDGYRGASIVTWSAFRSILDEPVPADIRQKVVLVALKIKATRQLSGVVDQFNCIAEAELPAYSGSGSGAAAWTSAFSRNPAAAFLLALRGHMSPRPVANTAIDWARLESWFQLCASKGWTCDAVVANGERLRDILQKIAATGRASLTIRDGLYSVVVDEPKTTVIQHFTPRNVKSFAWTKAFPDYPHGLKINIISADDGYAPNERPVYDDGYTEANATKYQQADMWGVTSLDLAWKHGRYRIAVAKLRPEAYTIEVDPEGIVCEPGDLVVLSHDAILVGHISGRVKAVTVDGGGDVIGLTLDEPVTMELGGSYGVRLRRTADGSSIYRAVDTDAGTGYTIDLATPIPAASAPAVGDLYTFGDAGIETMRCIVAGVEPTENMDARIYLVDEAPGVHDADSGTIPAYESRVSRPPQLDIGVIIDGSDPTPIPEDPAIAELTAGVGVYASNTPPTNNISFLAFSSADNPSGAVDLTVTFDYTQGAVPADGFLVFAKRDVTTPGPIDLQADLLDMIPAKPSATAETYSKTYTLPTRQKGAGTLPIHYRFGVVAFGTRRSGTVIHAGGVVEDATTHGTPPDEYTWIDKTFGSKLEVDEEAFWDLVTKYLRNNGVVYFGTETHHFGFVPPGVTHPVLGTGPRVVVGGAQLELTSAELITNADGVALYHEGNAMVWRNSATSEEIARIGLDGVAIQITGIEKLTPGFYDGWDLEDSSLWTSKSFPEYSQDYARGHSMWFLDEQTVYALIEPSSAGVDRRLCTINLDADTYTAEDFLPSSASLRGMVVTNIGGVERIEVIYTDGTTLYCITRTAGIWGSAVSLATGVSTAANSIAVGRFSDDRVVVTYAAGTARLMRIKSTALSWASAVTITSSVPVATYVSIATLWAGGVRFTYRAGAGNDLSYRDYVTGFSAATALSSITDVDGGRFATAQLYDQRFVVIYTAAGSNTGMISVDGGAGVEFLSNVPIYLAGIWTSPEGRLCFAGLSSAYPYYFVSKAPVIPFPLGPGFKRRGIDASGAYYELFDGAKIRVDGYSLTAYVGPQGETGNKGDQGEKGDTGDPGTDATIAVGTVTPGENPEDATVTNVGTPQNAVFDFTLPKGDPGTTVPDMSGLTEDANPDPTADYLLTYDASASAHKKVLADRLGVPVGTILSTARADADDGYLLCTGAAVSRLDYARLFARIGTTYGVGDGSTTFNIPDLREAALVGVGTRDAGAAFHDAFSLGQYKDDQMQQITGYFRNTQLRIGFSSSSGALSASSYGSDGTSGASLAGTRIDFDSANSPNARTGETTRGKRLGVNFQIKY